MEKTLVIIKPDGVERKLVGQIIARFEAKGLTLCQLKLGVMSQAVAEEHYAHVKNQAFFPTMIDYITASAVVFLVLEGEEAIKVVRGLIGATNPLEAAPGTIRGDFGLCQSKNVIHASDSKAAAESEIERFFF